MYRNIGDKVSVVFLGEIVDGIVKAEGGNSTLLYQVWLDNGKQTQLWFKASEVLNRLPKFLMIED